jgi:hypothetical protein
MPLTGGTQQPVVAVKILISPGPAPGMVRAAGIVPVAILSSSDFDATRVLPESLLLTGYRLKLVATHRNGSCEKRDVNGDNLTDLLCQMSSTPSRIEAGVGLVVLEGRTADGTKIRGEAPLRILSDK